MKDQSSSLEIFMQRLMIERSDALATWNYKKRQRQKTSHSRT